MKIVLMALLTLSLPVYAQHSHSEHVEHTTTKRKAVSEKEKVEILEVLAKNDLLFNSFLKKDSSSVEKHAKELQLLMSNKKSSLLKDSKAQAVKLASIKASNKAEDNMKAYESFLNSLIKVVQDNDVDSKYNIFSCPMVKKSWLQDITTNKEVKNVYAMDMLECGTQDTHF